MNRYQPISCSLHDQYLDWATRGSLVDIHYKTEEGPHVELSARIIDVFTRDGAEFMQLAGGLELRLDRVLRAESHS